MLENLFLSCNKTTHAQVKVTSTSAPNPTLWALHNACVQPVLCMAQWCVCVWVLSVMAFEKNWSHLATLYMCVVITKFGQISSCHYIRQICGRKGALGIVLCLFSDMCVHQFTKQIWKCSYLSTQNNGSTQKRHIVRLTLFYWMQRFLSCSCGHEVMKDYLSWQLHLVRNLSCQRYD